MNTTELIATVGGVAGSALVAYLAYKRGTRADDEAADNAESARIYAGYGGLLQRIQEDNADLRRRLEAAEQRIAELLLEMMNRNRPTPPER